MKNQEEIKFLKNDIKEKNKIVKQWNKLLKDLKKTQSQIADFQNYLTNIESLQVNMVHWTGLIEDLSNFVSKTNSLWLTELICREDGFQLKGYSLFHSRIYKLASYFKDITIDQVLRAKKAGRLVYEFTLTIGFPNKNKVSAMEKRIELARERQIRGLK